LWNPRRHRAYYKTRTGAAAARSGQLEQAERYLCEALDLDHEFTDARLWLGFVYEQQHEPRKALRQYQVGLTFDPQAAGLRQALQQAQAGTQWESTRAHKQIKGARSRRIPNIVFALLVPCGGFAMGLWEMATAEVPEWRELGMQTVLFALAGMAGQFILLLLIALLIGS